MNSIIIVSKNKEFGLQKVSEICEKEEISQIDRDFNDFEKAVGIGDIREVQKKLFLRPIKSKSKASIFISSQGITLQAQNALLKILEEPPENTFIFLVVGNKNDLIPTVISRCKIIEAEEKRNFDKEDLMSAASALEKLRSASVGERLVLAQDFSTSKDGALIFLESAVFSGREQLLKNPKDEMLLRILQEFQSAYSKLRSTNATVRLTLENLFLSL